MQTKPSPAIHKKLIAHGTCITKRYVLLPEGLQENQSRLIFAVCNLKHMESSFTKTHTLTQLSHPNIPLLVDLLIIHQPSCGDSIAIILKYIYLYNLHHTDRNAAGFAMMTTSPMMMMMIGRCDDESVPMEIPLFCRLCCCRWRHSIAGFYAACRFHVCVGNGWTGMMKFNVSIEWSGNWVGVCYYSVIYIDCILYGCRRIYLINYNDKYVNIKFKITQNIFFHYTLQNYVISFFKFWAF